MFNKLILSFLIFSLSLSLSLFNLQADELNNSLPSTSGVSTVNEAFKASLTDFINEKKFPEAVVSVYQNGNKIIDECYGTCEDSTKIYPIASVSKLFTEAAINQLVFQEKVTLDTKVISYLNLDYAVLDSRVKEITIEQLLDHTGGWDRDISDDPLFSFDTLPKEINSNDRLLKYVLTNCRLDHNPGEVESYSNFGYFLLGMVIEKATGEKYLDYLNKHFAEPNHIHLYQAQLPKPESKDSGLNFFNLELSTASFGLAADLSDLGYFFSKVDRQGFEKTNQDNQNQADWWKDGSLPGSVTSLVKQRPNNVVIAVYIPSRNEDSWMDDNEKLNNLIDYTAKNVGL